MTIYIIHFNNGMMYEDEWYDDILHFDNKKEADIVCEKLNSKINKQYYPSANYFVIEKELYNHSSQIDIDQIYNETTS